MAPSEENDKLSIDKITQNYNLPGFKSSVFLNIQHCYVGIKADNAQNVLSLSEIIFSILRKIRKPYEYSTSLKICLTVIMALLQVKISLFTSKLY